MTWQRQFCHFLKKIKISTCVFSKASFPHLSRAATFGDSGGFGDSCAFNTVVAMLPKGDCAFNLGWHLVGVRFGVSLEVSFRLGIRILLHYSSYVGFLFGF